MVARLLETKGVREFVEAARIVRSTHPNARFVLVGDYDPNPAGLGRAEVESWVAAGIVDYRGSVSDVRPVLEEASVFVLPSWSEGISRSTLEAMATGRAVITTDAQGCRETVKHGETGYLVPVRSPTALASAMCELLNNPSRIADFGEAAYHFCAETFAVERVNAQVIAALRA
jgi:glycosyltransferase involved in cell wall biosynthesis